MALGPREGAVGEGAVALGLKVLQPLPHPSLHPSPHTLTTLPQVDRMVDAGHFKELDNILQLLQQRSNGGSGVEGEEADTAAGEAAAVGAGEAGAAAGGAKAAARQTSPRQIFLFSATLMLPPNAKEANAKKLKAHKNINKSKSTMEALLAKLKFQNALKVLDLSLTLASSNPSLPTSSPQPPRPNPLPSYPPTPHPPHPPPGGRPLT